MGLGDEETIGNKRLGAIERLDTIGALATDNS